MRPSYRFWLLLFLALVASAMLGSLASASPEVELTVPDTSVMAGSGYVWISIHLANHADTIAGFQFVLKSSRPDLVWFSDEAGPVFDTLGTLLTKFEYVEGRLDAEDSGLVWFRCISNSNPFDGKNYWGFPPQTGDVVTRLRLNVADHPPEGDLTSYLTVEPPYDYSNPYGVSIGMRTDTVVDTHYWKCMVRDSNVCLSWAPVDPDTIAYDTLTPDTTYYGYLDTAVVVTFSGSLTLQLPGYCDVDVSGALDLADLGCIVDFLFAFPLAPACAYPCDFNLDGFTDISDLTLFVDYLFFGGPPPQP